MRIVYLHQYFVTPDMSGGARSYHMARRLVAMGHEVHMVTSDQQASGTVAAWRTTQESGIIVHWAAVPYDNSMSYADRLRAFFSFAWRAARKAAQLRPDIVFATSTPLTIALPAVYAARRARCPMVFEVRDLWPEVPIAIGAIRNPVAKWGARWLERFAYRNARHVVALAPGMREAVISSGFPADRVHVIPNGADLDTVPDPSVGQRIRAEFPWLGSRPLLVFTGTFGLVNGMDYLVRLAVAVRELDIEIRIVAVGGGREFARTKELALEHRVLDETLFLMGKVPRGEAAAWVRAADMTLALFTGPEIVWKDAVQNKFFDSLAAGVPIANNFRGWQSIVASEAGAGIILSATDLAAAARDLVSALRDQEWLQSARAAALDLALTRFDRQKLAEQLERVICAARDGTSV